MDACQQRFLEALEGAANYAGIDSSGLALHHVIGGMMVEHADHPRVKAALKLIKDREHARVQRTLGGYQPEASGTGTPNRPPRRP